ncbi:MAG TPA: biotin carboxylase N-terminal domain-containing protein [Nocardioides sp.]|uniref:acetyl/propionyl/methylcrotonyl-CoA carboxylase subunit alpha n=1 Tax=Nocardioides sp. TaxID=35761 RepID=UPI002C60E33C|nr:biotin carboxylase N-terminal domain-containing protein [Nocardioides sp.]HQR28254.1 biotin carboxylase N-terminal domain-containing protein [Nocardioides sp.]
MSAVFTTLLVANRGEIALRVIRSAHALGVRCVAVHTELDRAAPHVRAADVAVAVPSYLDIDAVVAAAVATGAEAVHPGYGFLSERAAFAQAVEAAGLVLVGPSARVMEQMGRKDAAREIAVRAGVPVVPTGQDAAYPVLVKAAAGGGGKGMRIVRTAEEHDEAVAAARREAAAAFGDDTLLVEKYVERGRHIEVQVLGDSHGNVVHLFERDCSTQRRHQKVVEEAPAPTLTDAQRRLVTESAVALAREVGYVNAGTVEFLLDTATGAAYFLEMNTRLQVEHPVTELVTGVDLVALQLRIAAGEPLPFTQDDVRLSGHAIEARIYAEDPFHGFLPQAGTPTLVRWPEGVRVDAALESGRPVSAAYDPMLGKVIVHGADRETARQALVAALDRTTVLGLTTNTGFVRALVAGAAFREAAIDTAYLDRTPPLPPPRRDARLVAAWMTARAARATGAGPFAADGWRLAGPPAPVTVELDEVLPVTAHTAGDVRVEELEHVPGPDGRFDVVLSLDGVRHRAAGCVLPHVVEVVLEGQRHLFDRPDVFADHAVHAGDGTILAPMPGSVVAVRVAVGDHVEEGQLLGMMEAMKMELALTAPFAGTVTEVGAVAGRQAALGDRLFVVEPREEQP